VVLSRDRRLPRVTHRDATDGDPMGDLGGDVVGDLLGDVVGDVVEPRGTSWDVVGRRGTSWVTS
jgi:hypothetical protein